MHKLETPFGLGDPVYLDGDQSIRMRVTAITVRGRANIQYEVSWWDERNLRTEWVAEWRLSPVKI